MKRILVSTVVLIAIICSAVWAAYSIGYRRGFDRALVLDQKGVFVGTFDALQKIRAGQIEAGTQRIEGSCFAAANSVYAGHSDCQFVASTFLKEFRLYRQAYRTNVAEWSIVEQTLERKLNGWK